MTISTLEYNANTPVPKQITVPTNSNFNVGVNVYRDGEQLSCGLDEITIDGLSATTQKAGYNVFSLSSDGTQCLKKCVVAVDKADSVDVDVIVEDLVFDNPAPFPMTVTKTVQLSSMVAAGEYDLRWFGLPEFTVDDGTKDWWTDGGNTVRIYPNGVGPGKPVFYIDVNAHLFWIARSIADVSKITFTNAAVIQLIWAFKSVGTVSADVSFDINSNDGLNTKFQLYIQQKDMGYIELK